jgi:hypothetical protein
MRTRRKPSSSGAGPSLALLAIALAGCDRSLAQTPPAPTPAPAPAPAPAATAPVDSTKPAARDYARSLPTPPADLGKILERFDKDIEPFRELKRCFAQALYYHLARDLEHVLVFFHKDFAFNKGTGEVVNVPPADLRALLEKNYREAPKTTLGLLDMVELDRLRVYTRAQARVSEDDGWKKEPKAIAALMADDDFLVIAPVKRTALADQSNEFETEVFYVLRREDGIFKVVLGE